MLLEIYNIHLKSGKSVGKGVTVWTLDSIQCLTLCFSYTDYNIDSAEMFPLTGYGRQCMRWCFPRSDCAGAELVSEKDIMKRDDLNASTAENKNERKCTLLPSPTLRSN